MQDNSHLCAFEADLKMHFNLEASVVISSAPLGMSSVERYLGGGHELLPMAVSHGWAPQICYQRNTDREVLQALIKTLHVVQCW